MPHAARRLPRLRSLGFRLAAVFLAAALLAPAVSARGEKTRGKSEPAKKALTFVDLMKFRTVKSSVLSDDGSTLAYHQAPDRGDGEVVVTRSDGSLDRRIALGSDPVLDSTGQWALVKLVPSLEAVETAEDDAPEAGAAVLNVATGEVSTFDHVSKMAMSHSGPYVALLHTEKPSGDEDAAAEGDDPPEAAEGISAEESGVEGGAEIAGESAAAEAPEKPSAGGEESTTGEEKPATGGEEVAEVDADEEAEVEERTGTTLRLVNLETGDETTVESVTAFAFSDTSPHVAYAVAVPGGENGLYVQRLDDTSEPVVVTADNRGHYTALTWTEKPHGEQSDLEVETLLAFVAAVDDADGEPGDGEVWVWPASSGEGRAVASADNAPAGSFIPSVNKLRWSLDGERLFYGTKLRPKPEPDVPEKEGFDPYDVEAMLSKKGLDVWHVDDPLIKTNEIAQWDENEKDRIFMAVYHRAAGSNVQLAGGDLREVGPTNNARAVLGVADVPYLRERTWAGFFVDLYWISLDDGRRQLIAERLNSGGLSPDAQQSPDGRYAVYYRGPHWYLFDADAGTSRVLTEGLEVSFADEDHDYPREAPSYGVGGWLADSSAVLIHDKYDLWSFPTAAGGDAIRITGGAGREASLKLRVVDEGLDGLDKATVFQAGQRVLLHGEREREKNHGFWRLTLDSNSLDPLVEGPYQFRFRARAKAADRVLFTRESYREFPDLRVTGPDFKEDRKVSNVNPQIADFAWGNAELVSFKDVDGRSADAVLIRPEGLAEGERCPVLVYYYRFFSHRLYGFNDPKVNHRPSFPVYASHGYCVFLPDVRFEIGRPGFSATKALVPAVQKIVDMGVADPDRVGLHGHSWSGYQTAFVVTQTHLFAAAVAGAPVSNMTSAYGGIRYGTGLARQFQYEAGQSRLGRSLWESRDLYIENSPLFYADRIETPLLIQFGDADEAVPWTQGVELYLALRRLDKEAVFLQYRGEPHHLKQYPNKLDYSMKMKEFFDHYLKDAPAPVWLSDGVPYRGEDE